MLNDEVRNRRIKWQFTFSWPVTFIYERSSWSPIAPDARRACRALLILRPPSSRERALEVQTAYAPYDPSVTRARSKATPPRNQDYRFLSFILQIFVIFNKSYWMLIVLMDVKFYEPRISSLLF